MYSQHLNKLTCKWRGRRLPSRSTGIFSSPSGDTVWVVKEKILHTMSHALLQLKCSSSTSTLMTSATARDGWVSFSCKATYITKIIQLKWAYLKEEVNHNPCKGYKNFLRKDFLGGKDFKYKPHSSSCIYRRAFNASVLVTTSL